MTSSCVRKPSVYLWHFLITAVLGKFQTVILISIVWCHVNTCIVVLILNGIKLVGIGYLNYQRKDMRICNLELHCLEDILILSICSNIIIRPCASFHYADGRLIVQFQECSKPSPKFDRRLGSIAAKKLTKLYSDTSWDLKVGSVIA